MEARHAHQTTGRPPGTDGRGVAAHTQQSSRPDITTAPKSLGQLTTPAKYCTTPWELSWPLMPTRTAGAGAGGRAGQACWLVVRSAPRTPHAAGRVQNQHRAQPAEGNSGSSLPTNLSYPARAAGSPTTHWRTKTGSPQAELDEAAHPNCRQTPPPANHSKRKQSEQLGLTGEPKQGVPGRGVNKAVLPRQHAREQQRGQTHHGGHNRGDAQLVAKHPARGSRRRGPEQAGVGRQPLVEH